MMVDEDIYNPNHFTNFSHIFIVPLHFEMLLSQEKLLAEFVTLKDNYQRIIARVQEYEKLIEINPSTKAQKIWKNLFQASLIAAKGKLTVIKGNSHVEIFSFKQQSFSDRSASDDSELFERTEDGKNYQKLPMIVFENAESFGGK